MSILMRHLYIQTASGYICIRVSSSSLVQDVSIYQRFDVYGIPTDVITHPCPDRSVVLAIICLQKRFQVFVYNGFWCISVSNIYRSITPVWFWAWIIIFLIIGYSSALICHVFTMVHPDVFEIKMKFRQIPDIAKTPRINSLRTIFDCSETNK